MKKVFSCSHIFHVFLYNSQEAESAELTLHISDMLDVTGVTWNALIVVKFKTHSAVCWISIKAMCVSIRTALPARESPVNNTPGPHGKKQDFHIGCESAEAGEVGLGFTLLGSRSFGE